MGDILYHIDPSGDQGYTPGNCTFHLQEDESWKGANSPGFARHWDFHLEKLTLNDTAGTTIGTIPGDPIEAGAGNAFSWNTSLPDLLVMTPEAVHDYIQFSLGSQSWTSSDTDNTKMPFCSDSGYNKQYSPDVSLPFLDTSMCCGDTSRLKESFAKVMVDHPFECFYDFQFFLSKTFAANELVRVTTAHRGNFPFPNRFVCELRANFFHH